MNKRFSLLPRMAANNIRKNGQVYFPYIGVSIFAVFTYFVFDLIRKNDVMKTLPRAAYANILISIGFVLLGLIMVPFLYYTNSFLIKRRKKELGLYSILGLEKKHIGVMMFWESLFVYLVVVAAAVLMGLIFSRLIFLLLLNLAKLPVEAEFTFSIGAVTDTMIFYAFITGLNLFVNLIQVGKANPVELMSDTRRGEKEPKLIGIWSVAGIAALVIGYRMAINARLNSMIFTDFFGAVFLVIMGTYFLFTSGSIAVLRLLKKKKGFYYRPENFITVSGMLYRMKKNAASLSNICVFSTMVIITVVCTVAIYMGMDSLLTSGFSRVFEVVYSGNDRVDGEVVREGAAELAAGNQVAIYDELAYPYVKVDAYQEGNVFQKEGSQYDYSGWKKMLLMTQEEYNLLEGMGNEPGSAGNLSGGTGYGAEDAGNLSEGVDNELKSVGSLPEGAGNEPEGADRLSGEINNLPGEAEDALQPGEVLLFSDGADFGRDSIRFEEMEYSIRRELHESKITRKLPENEFADIYVIVFANREELNKVSQLYGVDGFQSVSYLYGFLAEGAQEDIDNFSKELEAYASGLAGFAQYKDHRSNMKDQESMYGGLLFIGIFFGLIFLICLLIIMYYKQITEGFEDQKNFEIMQKVGMGDGEIRRTIKKQIRMVFILPLIGAVLHTAIGMRMVYMLMGAIGFFEKGLLAACTLGGCTIFAIVYILSYGRTSMAYYRIVKQMN